MDQTRNEIWDFLYRTGPQTVEQIANGLGIDVAIVNVVVFHDWFEILDDATVRIATTKPPNSTTELSI